METPSLFVRAFLYLEPYPYQELFLNDSSSRIIVCAGRQTGKSTMASGKAIHFAYTRSRNQILLISSTLRQSMLMMDKIRGMLYGGSPLIRRSIIRETRKEFEFSNGSKITALPCGPSGNSLRGYTAHLVIVDEAAYVPDDVLSKVISPMLSTTSGTEILLSTPWDRDHTFYKVYNTEGWNKYHFPSSVNPKTTKEFLQEQRELYGEARYAQEYEAVFTDDERSYFPSPILRQCVHSCGALNKACKYCELFFSYDALCRLAGRDNLYGGYDPGGREDPAAFVVVEKQSEIFRVVHSRTYLRRNEDDAIVYSRFTQEISDLHKALKLRKVYVDETGLGLPIVETCKEYGLPAEGITLTAKAKEELLSNLKISFERKKVLLPAGNQGMISSLSCVEYDRRPGGGYSFSHRAGTHDDLAYALALAMWGAMGNNKMVVSLIKSEDDKRDWRMENLGI